jgi:TP901 family phage tail tape measure protein
MSRAAAATLGLGGSVDDTARRTSGGLGRIGQAGMIGTGLLVAGFGSAVAKSMEFETAMSAVSAATGATGDALAELRETAMRAGAATQYSAKEAADGITEMSKAGVSAADIMGGGLDGALALAAAGQIDVARAAELASAAMTQFGLSGADLPHVADLLAAGAGKALGSVDDLGQALNQAGLIADAAGLSIDETTAGLAAFASAGLLGSDAGTSLKTMLQALQAPSGKSAELMDELGLKMYDANGNMLGLAEMAGQLQDKLGGLTEEQRNAALAQIFGSDAVRAANVLYREGAAGIEDWTEKVNDQGFAADQAAKLNDNLKGDLERLGGAFDTLLISVGSGTQGPLRVLAQMLTGIVDVVGDVVGVINEVPAGFLLAGAAIGGYLLFGEKLIAQMALMRVWMNANIFSPLIVGFANMLTPVATLTGAFAAARTALSGLLTMAAPLAVMAAITYGVIELVKFANAGDDARDAIEQMNKTIDKSDTNAARFSNVTGSLDQIRDKINELRPFVESWAVENRGFFERSFIPVTGEVEDARQSLQEYEDSLASIQAEQSRMEKNLDVLGRRYGMTKTEVEEFADAHGIDLSGSLQIVQGDFIRVADAAGYAATGLTGVNGAAETGYENLVTYAAALGMSDDEVEELRKHTDELGEAISAFVDPLGTYTGLIDEKKEAERKSAEATAAATASQSDSWEDYVDDVSVSVEEYLTKLEEQVAAQDAWQANMLTLAGRVSQGTIDELARMGPEGAPLVAELVNASDTELARLETVFGQRSSNAASEFGEQLLLAQPVLTRIAATAGQETAAALAQQLAAGTTTVAAIAAQYGIVLADGINPVLTSLGKSAIIAAAPRQINGTRVAYADGGYISGPGSGTSDSIPAMLSNGEFVVRAASVNKYGVGLLSNINEGRAMFAKGGFVSAADVPQPRSTAPFGAPLSTGANAAMAAGYNAATAFLAANAETSYSGAAGPAGSTAIGGGWQTIWNIVKAAIPQARINSTYRPGDPGYHGRGKAIDFGFGGGPGGAGSAGLASIARFLYNGYGSTLAELIYDGVGDNTPDVKNGRPHTYNAGTQAEHRNHVHAAVYDQGGLLPSGTAALNLSGSPEMVLNPAQTAAAMRSREFSGSAGQIGSQTIVVEIAGAEITGTLQMGGDGLMRIVDGRILSAITGSDQRSRMNP